MEQLKIAFLRKLFHGFQSIFVSKWHSKFYNFSEQREMRFMRHQSQHDQISVLPIHTVPCVGLITRISPHFTNVLHNFVLPFPWKFMATKDNLQISPIGIILYLFSNKIFDHVRNPCHKFGSWSDTVRIEWLVKCVIAFEITILPRQHVGIFRRLFHQFCHILCAAKASTTLLIEFRTRRHAINCHIDGYFRLHNLCNDPVDVVHNAEHHVPLAEPFRNVHVRWMGASVNYTVHI
mmetsp:Transcript_34976/g.42208  ORF Transcript_34976/g.42208 Transcript_34976/m.42208 type:complete len:235 (-) Transcript_34976:197-901(-)